MPRHRSSKKKYCPFTTKKIPADVIDYKNVRLIRKYVTETGFKIVPARITGVARKFQARIAEAVRLARYLALIPYTDRHK